jgi:hypothetical protein
MAASAWEYSRQRNSVKISSVGGPGVRIKISRDGRFYRVWLGGHSCNAGQFRTIPQPFFRDLGQVTILSDGEESLPSVLTSTS